MKYNNLGTQKYILILRRNIPEGSEVLICKKRTEPLKYKHFGPEIFGPEINFNSKYSDPEPLKIYI